MTLEELTTLYQRVVGDGGAICPKCHGNMTEDLRRGHWQCWWCGQQFTEDDRDRPVAVLERAS